MVLEPRHTQHDLGVTNVGNVKVNQLRMVLGGELKLHGFKANGTGPDRRAVDRLEMIRCGLFLDGDLVLLDGAMIDEVSGGAGINHGDEARLVLDWMLDWIFLGGMRRLRSGMRLDWVLGWVLESMKRRLRVGALLLDLVLDWTAGVGSHSDVYLKENSGRRHSFGQTAGRQYRLT